LGPLGAALKAGNRSWNQTFSTAAALRERSKCRCGLLTSNSGRINPDIIIRYAENAWRNIKTLFTFIFSVLGEMRRRERENIQSFETTST
jgi:hypothetical protein